MASTALTDPAIVSATLTNPAPDAPNGPAQPAVPPTNAAADASRSGWSPEEAARRETQAALYSQRSDVLGIAPGASPNSRVQLFYQSPHTPDASPATLAQQSLKTTKEPTVVPKDRIRISLPSSHSENAIVGPVPNRGQALFTVHFNNRAAFPAFPEKASNIPADGLDGPVLGVTTVPQSSKQHSSSTDGTTTYEVCFKRLPTSPPASSSPSLSRAK